MSQISVSDAPAVNLDPEKVGNILLRLGLAAYQLGHETVTGTLNPYCNHPELQSPESQFVRDIFSLDTRTLVDRWYGGDLSAREMLLRTVPSAFEPDSA